MSGWAAALRESGGGVAAVSSGDAHAAVKGSVGEAFGLAWAAQVVRWAEKVGLGAGPVLTAASVVV